MTKELTKREYFAAMAMQGLIVNRGADVGILVDYAIRFADALIAELEKERERSGE